jgi:hypothetical protein
MHVETQPAQARDEAEEKYLRRCLPYWRSRSFVHWETVGSSSRFRAAVVIIEAALFFPHWGIVKRVSWRC